MSHSSDLPRRPIFSWDIRTVSWNGGTGRQEEEYVSAVRTWLSFHNKLPKTNKNKVPEGLQGIRLHSRLYVRAKDLCKDIPLDAIDSENMLTEFPKQYINEMLFSC